MARGEWRQVLGRALVAGGAQLTQAQYDLAAQLSIKGSVLAGPAAARAWGMPVPDDRIMLLVDPHCSAGLKGVLLVYGRLGRREVASIDGARVTTRERTVFDCLRVLPERSGLDFLDRALQQGWVTIESLGGEVFRHVGQRGVPKVRRLVRLVSGGERSEAERVLTGLLRGSGIIGWRANAPIFDERGLIGLGDLVFEGEKLVIEIDGWAYHVRPDRFQRDRRRQNRLVRAGWRVLRFTWRDVTERPQYVISAITAQVRVA